MEKHKFALALLVLFLAASGCVKPDNGTVGRVSDESELPSPMSSPEDLSELYVPVIADFELITDPLSTKDGMMTAQIIRYAGDDSNVIRLTEEDRLLADILFENSNQVLNLEWLGGDSILAVTSHINPSTNQYLVIELNEKYKTSYYYGFAFVWNESFTNLYYIKPDPHFSEGTVNSLMDKNENVLYRTMDNNRMTAAFAVSPDENHFAVVIRTLEAEETLVILKRFDDETANPVGIIGDFSGDFSFLDNETLKITLYTGEARKIMLKDILQYGA